MIRFIGDVHGKMNSYAKAIGDAEKTIQVGDFGAGFVDLPKLEMNHRFIRGNHDSPEICKNHPNWIKDGTVEGSILFVGGAKSTDQALRTENIDWWRDEQITYDVFSRIINNHERMRSDIIVSHDCPSVVSDAFGANYRESSITRNGLDALFITYPPRLWIFGHWHMRFNVLIGRTRFICLNELETFDLE